MQEGDSLCSSELVSTQELFGLHHGSELGELVLHRAGRELGTGSLLCLDVLREGKERGVSGMPWWMA
jgi:hypothetical protein